MAQLYFPLFQSYQSNRERSRKDRGLEGLVLAYFLLNDLLLGMVVGDNENKEEKVQLEAVLQNLSNKSNFKVNF